MQLFRALRQIFFDLRYEIFKRSVSNSVSQKLKTTKRKKTKTQATNTKVIVPSSFSQETTLKTIWNNLLKKHFPDRLDLKKYRLVWSKRRRTASLASCNTEKKRILIAQVMKQKECLPYLEALVYHEMCHAALGKPKVVHGRRSIHGKDFHKLERKHLGIKFLNKWIKAGGWRAAVKKENSTLK